MLSRLTLAAILFTQVFYLPVAFALPLYNPGDIVISEFSVSGTEWVEILNTTSSDISLTGWDLEIYTLTPEPPGPPTSAAVDLDSLITIPSYGLVVVTPPAMDDQGAVIYIKDPSTTVIDAVSYGDASLGAGEAHASAPAMSESAYLQTPPSTWAIATTPSRGWYNNATNWTADDFNGITTPTTPPTLSSLGQFLATDNILTNLPAMTNPTDSNDFFFAKVLDPMGSPDDPANIIGRIDFDGPLNLTDQQAVEYLKSIGDKMDMAGTAGSAVVGMETTIGDTTEESVFKALPATITMGGLSALGAAPGLIVKDNDGVVIDPSDPVNYPAIDTTSPGLGFNDTDNTFEFTTSHFTSFETFTDADAVAADLAALSADDIKGANPDLDHITVDLTQPLPSSGANGTTITWLSNNHSYLADDGTVTRPAFGDGNAGFNLDATISKNAASDTKVFSVTIMQSSGVISEATPVSTPSSDPTPTFQYNTTVDVAVTAGGQCAGYSGPVAGFAASNPNSFTFWDLPTGLYDNCTLIARDLATNTIPLGEFVLTPFTIVSNNAKVTSATYTVSTIGGGSETITNVPYATSKADFLAALTKDEPNQTWDDSDLDDPVVSGNSLTVTAQDGLTQIVYVVTVNLPIPSFPNNYLIGTGTTVDASVDGAGDVHAVYVDGGSVYYVKNRATPELLATGSLPTIWVASDGTPHVIFADGGMIKYINKLGGTWSSAVDLTGVVNPTSLDLDIDTDGYLHIAYSKASSENYSDIQYLTNASGSFIDTQICHGYYWSGSGGNFCGYPVGIKVDGAGFYHLSYVDGWRDNTPSYSTQNMSYSTNSPAGGSSSGAFNWNSSPVSTSKNNIAFDGAGNVNILYMSGGVLYRGTASAAPWGQTSLGAASFGSIYYAGSKTGIAYNNSGVKYIENAGPGYTPAASIDAAGSNPVAVVDASNHFVYYEKSGSIYLATDKDVSALSATAVTPNKTAYNRADIGSDTFTLTIDFNANMDTGLDPTITFSPLLTALLTNRSGVWSDTDTYVMTAGITDQPFDSDDIDVTVSGAKDTLGNTMNGRTDTALFNIDLQGPVLAFANDVQTGPVAGDIINITATDANLVTTDYGFSTDAVCNASDTYGNAFTSGLDFTISSEAQNGQYLCARGIDGAGNTTFLTSANDLNVDVTQPQVTLTSSTPANFFSAPLHATATFNEAVTGFEIGDLTVGNGTATNFVPVSSTVYTFDVTPSALGTVTVDVNDSVAYDLAGVNNSAATQLSRYYDNSAPTVGTPAITPSYSAGSVYIKGMSDISATVSDIGSGLNEATCAYTLDGTATSHTVPGAYFAGECNFYDVNTASATNINVLICDNAGACVWSPSFTPVVVDTLGPSVNAGTDVTTNVQIPQDATTSDAGSDIASWQWDQISGPGTVTFGSSNSEDTTIDADTDGTYVLELTATDNLGQQSSDQMTFVWDSTDPTGTIDSPIDGAILSGTVTINATASDTGSGLSKVEFWYNAIGTKIGEDSTAPYSINWDTTGASEGPHTLFLMLYDNAGNVISTNGTGTAVTIDNTAPTVTKLGDGTGDYTLAALASVDLVFNEEISTAGKTAVQEALAAGSDTVLDYTWNPANDTLTIGGHATDLATFANDVTAVVSDVAGNAAVDLLLIDSSLDAAQTDPTAGVVVLAPGTNQVVLNDSQPTTITIPTTVTTPTLNVDPLIDGTTGTATLPASITVNSTTSAGAVDVQIPAGTTITGPTGWSGIINLPQVQATTSVTPPVSAGESATVSEVIELGFSNTVLTFDRGVRIRMAGQSGKMAGYSRSGVFTKITTVCSADSQAAGDALPAGGDCKINSGGDLIIWTKHFTSFVAYTVSTSGGGGGGGGGGSAAFGRNACVGAACDGTVTDTGNTDTVALVPLQSFSDTSGHWAEHYIMTALEQHYVSGYEDNSFRPEQPINRAEVAKLVALWKDQTLSEENCPSETFSDVRCADWFGHYVNYLALEKIISGYQDGTFRPGNEITRAEALKILLYAKGLEDTDVSGYATPFSDLKTGDWYNQIVLIASKLGIVSGYQNGTFGPNRSITRAEFTKIFVETLLTEG